MRVRTLIMLVVGAAMLLPQPAHASGLWETYKALRPFGQGCTVYGVMHTFHIPGIDQDLVIQTVPNTNHTSAPLPSDVDLTIRAVFNGHSGRLAKDKDRKRLRLLMLDPISRRWRILDEQDPEQEKKLPRDERWSGVLEATLRATTLPFGILTFKVDFPYDRDTPMIQLNRVNKSFAQMAAEMSGSFAEGAIPPTYNGNHVPNGVPMNNGLSENGPPNGGYASSGESSPMYQESGGVPPPIPDNEAAAAVPTPMPTPAEPEMVPQPAVPLGYLTIHLVQRRPGNPWHPQQPLRLKLKVTDDQGVVRHHEVVMNQPTKTFLVPAGSKLVPIVLNDPSRSWKIYPNSTTRVIPGGYTALTLWRL